MEIKGLNIEEKNYIVAFVDVLGTKELIKQDSKTAMNNLWLISHSINKAAYGKDVIIRTFSDNFFIAIETDKDNPKNFGESLNTIGNIVGNLMYRCATMYNVLIRGAIAYGKMRINEDIIIGEALINAYNLESNVAIYPRIIIDESIPISCLNDSTTWDLTKPFFLDRDKLICLNGMMFSFHGDAINSEMEKYLLGNIANQITIAEKTNNPKVKAKINWYINYIINFINQNSGKPDSVH